MSTSDNDGTGGAVAQRTDLKMANSDQPGSQLVTAVFDGENFLSWSKSIRFALGAKSKLGLITGSSSLPATGDEARELWFKADYMIRCWIINSMSKGIASGFRHVSSALVLWTELQERYEQSNLPLLFQLRRNVANLRQENLNVSDYYGKLKLLWDDICSIYPIVYCSCASRAACNCELPKHLAASDNKNRVFSSVQQLEIQKSVSSISSPISSLYVGGASHDKTKGDGNKSSLICNYCKTFGHIVEKFYKLIGISAEFLVYFPAHKMFVKMSPWSNEVVDNICGLPFVLACFMKSSTDSFVCMAENWVFDPGGFKTTELELVVLGALHLFDEMPCISVLVCEMRLGSAGVLAWILRLFDDCFWCYDLLVRSYWVHSRFGIVCFELFYARWIYCSLSFPADICHMNSVILTVLWWMFS